MTIEVVTIVVLVLVGAGLVWLAMELRAVHRDALPALQIADAVNRIGLGGA